MAQKINLVHIRTNAFYFNSSLIISLCISEISISLSNQWFHVHCCLEWARGKTKRADLKNTKFQYSWYSQVINTMKVVWEWLRLWTDKATQPLHVHLKAHSSQCATQHLFSLHFVNESIKTWRLREKRNNWSRVDPQICFLLYY